LNSELKKESVKYIKAFDNKGNIIMLDKKKSPDYPVIVISINERLDENGKVRECYLNKKDILLNNESKNLVLKKMFNNDKPIKILSDSIGNGGDDSPDITYTHKLMLWEFDLTGSGLNHFQDGNGWLEGDPEFYFDIWKVGTSVEYKGRSYVQIDDDPHCYFTSLELQPVTNNFGQYNVQLRIAEEDGGVFGSDDEMETVFKERISSTISSVFPFNIPNGWYDGINGYVNIKINWIKY
jgi:hypothetical protein